MKKTSFCSWDEVKHALLMFLPLFLLTNGMLWLVFHYERQEHERTIAFQALNRINMQCVKIGSDFRLIVSDLLFFANYSQLHEMLDDPKIHQEDLLRDFILFSMGSKLYDQIRILDTTGMELVRVNFSNAKPVVTPREELQFKGDRYYFKDSIDLAKGEIFVSPFDLNIEHGEIEQPPKPMIRFTTPIFSRHNGKSGILIFNYLGKNIIRDVKDLVSGSPGNYMWLNSEGYWIIGRAPAEEWGFMFHDGKHHKMAEYFPQEWRVITSTDAGQFRSAAGLFTFNTVYPLLEGWKSSSGSAEAFGSSVAQKDYREYFWKIVSYVPESYFVTASNDILRKYIYISLMIGLVLITVSCFLGKSVVYRARSKTELLESYCVLEQKIDEIERINTDLNKALSEIKVLRGIIPICSFCKKIRNDKGFWEQVDVYVRQHADVDFSHGVCPDCAREHYPELTGGKTDAQAADDDKVGSSE